MTTRQTAARVALVATGAVAALVLAGCGGGQNAAAGGSPTTTGSDDSSFVPVTSTTVAPPPTAVSTGTTTETTTGGGEDRGGGSGGADDHRASGAPPECKPANLKLTLGPTNGAAGTFYAPLRFTNVSDATCVMVGWPGVSYVTGDNGTQVGQPAKRTGPKGPQVTLRPGAVASSVLAMTDVGVFDPAECKPTATRGLRVYPPDSTASMFVARPGRGCAGNPPSPQLRVEAVKPGAGSA